MAKHVLNRARNTTWEINSDDDVWILGEKGEISGDVVSMMGISTNDYVDNATIRIDGEIDLDGANSMGIYVTSKSARIAVSKEAHVSATGNAALYYTNSSGKVALDNKGLLQGEWAVQIGAAQNGASIRNDGRILGVGDAIIATGAGAMIVNAGIIKGSTGIALEEGQNDIDPLKAENATHIVNSGKIIGSSQSFNVSGVAVNIRNNGLLDGDVQMHSGDDVVNNRGGAINGWIGGRAGDDIISNRGGVVNGGIAAGDDNDVVNNRGGTIKGDIYGDEGDDVINMAGGKLNGVIYGGMGDDVVTLGSAAQVYVEYASQGDRDTVRINGTYQLGANIENLTLLGKGDHTGIGNSQPNVLIGNKGDNVLYSFAGEDRLYGGKGNDTLNSGKGNDTIDGGEGDDSLAGGEDFDIFIFEPGYGRDTIMDFKDGDDTIRLYGFGDFAAIDDKIEYSNGNAVIDLGDGDMIVIRDILPNSLTIADFVFN